MFLGQLYLQIEIKRIKGHLSSYLEGEAEEDSALLNLLEETTNYLHKF